MPPFNNTKDLFLAASLDPDLVETALEYAQLVKSGSTSGEERKRRAAKKKLKTRFIRVGGYLKHLVRSCVQLVQDKFSAWHGLDERMPEVNSSFSKVRNELYEVGLLADGVYLDQIELIVSWLPSMGEAGYVFDGETGLLPRLIGYESGVIYLPADVPSEAYVPGGTLTDVIRHEFAHAWYWLEPEFFDRKWFRDAFTVDYDVRLPIPRLVWEEKLIRNRAFRKRFKALKSVAAKRKLYEEAFFAEFVSAYAATEPCEDFAETFMIYLRYRNSLRRFKKRVGVYRKLRAVDKAVKVARRELGL